MKKKSRIKKRKQSKKHSGSRTHRKITRKKPKKHEKIQLSKSEFPDFGLSNSFKPMIDLSTSLENTIKPLQEAQLIINEKIKPFEFQLNDLEKNFPNLSAINTIVTENLKPIEDLQIKLSETTKPLIDFATQVDTILKPLTDIGIKLNENFPNLSAINTIVTENLKPIEDLQIKLSETIKPLIDFATQVDTTLKPLSEIKFDVDAQLKPLADYSIKLHDQLKPIVEFNNNLLNFTPEDLFPTKPLVNFATNFGSVSNEVNKELLGNTLSYYNPDELEVVEKPIKKSKKKKIKQLIEKLKNCEEGTEDWTEYQNICEEILSYCFGTDLMEPMVQSATTGRHNIRDIIYQIPHECDKFWKYIMFQFGMGIIIECKNYASPIDQNDVVITSKYFAPKKLTTFGIIFSRKPVGNSGKKGQEDAWVHNNKMIICLSDDDLIKMLELKENGEKPWKVIDKAMREIRLSI